MKRTVVVVALVAAVFAALPADASDFQIVNGTPAAAGEFPWMTAVLFDGGQGCGGAIIAPTWVLSAAHCFADDRGQLNSAPESITFVADATNWTQPGQTLQAAEIVLHPAYDATATANDIALVRLTAPTDIAPVAIAGPAHVGLNAPPTVGTVIGYGRITTDGPQSDTQLKVDIGVRPDGDCEGYGNYNPAVMVCAGDPTQDPNAPGDDSCPGDSGGPLVANVNGAPVQFGVVSFGGDCGVGLPGVYTRVTTFTEWVNGITGGTVTPGDPDPGPADDGPTGAGAPPMRIASGTGDDPVDQAIAMSQLIFQDEAEFGVLAVSANFPDALGGSALSSYLGPLLYVNELGQLEEPTLREFQRVLLPGSTIYILGGVNAISAEVEQTLVAAGFQAHRLGGIGREQTASLVADEVIATVNGGQAPPFGAVMVAYEGNWPDAVAAGQIASFWGIPILLTPTAQLGESARASLDAIFPEEVWVIGGTGVVSDTVVTQIEEITGPGTVTRLGGATRLETTAQVTVLNADELFPLAPEIFEFEGEPLDTPDIVVAVNLRRADGFAHVLAASQLTGNFGGVFFALEGEDGSISDQSNLDAICGLNAELVIAGGTNLVADTAVAQIQAASAGNGCVAP